VLLIDGYNLLFAVPGFDPRELAEGRDRFVDRLERFCRRTDQRARVYFDPKRVAPGPEPTRRRKRGAVEVVHLGGRSADRAILDDVAETVDRTAYRVVTSDRAVADGAAARGFVTERAEAFLAELESSERSPGVEKPDGCPPDQAEYWMRRFGLGGNPDEVRGPS
jgi:predicted RNA-binding protein with PIN domain